MQHYLYRSIRWFVFFGCLQLSIATHAASNTILIVGDSISAAYGMSLDQGWVALLASRIVDSHPHYRVVNASISGETTGGALNRLPELLQEHDPALVVIELGGNDGLRGYPIGRFKDNLRNLVLLSQNADALALLLPMEIPPNYGSRYTSSFRNSYRLVAEETGAKLGHFPLDGIATDPELMQADGIHPTVGAQEQLLDNIYPAIVEALEPQ